MKTKSILLALLFCTTAYANEIDVKLERYIEEFNFKAPTSGVVMNRPLFFLGRQIFHANSLSLAGDISCADCHSGARGTSDGLPLSIGTGAEGSRPVRTQGQAQVTKRHSPTLWNVSHDSVEFLFWDGRVKYAPGDILSPSDYINGPHPVLVDVVTGLINAAAVQALFPPLNKVEMRGENALDLNDAQTWELITENVLNDPATDMRTMFNLAYPGVEEFHIGHIAKALSHFQQVNFFVNDTPWDDYLRGDKTALSSQEKRGALLFMEKAKCAQCHSGERLSSGDFENVLVPDIGIGTLRNDLGRYEVTKKDEDKYKFLVPGLRNISLSAPYMHNGSLISLEQVVQHYNMPVRNLMHFSTADLENTYGRFYNDEFLFNTDRNVVRAQLETRSEKLVLNLRLNPNEVDDLVIFLKKSFTSRRWQGRTFLER